MYVIERCVYAGEIHNVAFYDRASTKAQSTNFIRQAYCDEAVAASAQLGFNLIRPNDTRNHGVCFLDVGTGTRSDNRPQLQRILNDESVDTVAFLVFDRIARGIDVWHNIQDMVYVANKNLIQVQHIADHLRDMRLAHELAAMFTAEHVERCLRMPPL